MVLGSSSQAKHNTMLGTKVPHPPSTKYDNDLETQPAKRFKRHESTDSSLSRQSLEDEESLRSFAPSGLAKVEIVDSEDETGYDNENEDEESIQRTSLETALPAVKTDEEAIADYETARAAENANLDVRGRLSKRKWIPGKSSIYVDAFNLALETVLDEEGHLFDEVETAVFEAWRNLNYEAQYLYVRLFLRKTATWHRINKLGYYGDVADMEKAVTGLLEKRELPKSTAQPQANAAELELPADAILKESFAFADSSAEHIATLEEASRLLLLDELKVFAKEARIQGKTKKELVNALRNMSGKQGGLGFSSLRRSETEESVQSEESATCELEVDDSGTKGNRDSRYVRQILVTTGDCIRLSPSPQKLFERVHLVFYRSTEWTEKSLTTIILARMARKAYPTYIISRSTNIYPSRAILLEFEAALRTQFRIDSILEFNGPVTREGLEEVLGLADAVCPRWRVLLAEEQQREESQYLTGEGAYLRRFSPAWVYTRILHKGLYPLGRFKEHAREHALLTELLDQQLFHPARRGAWYQRKAVLEEHYMAALTPMCSRSEEAQKKHWKRVALQTCETALQDNECHIIYHHDLQKRIAKLEKQLRVPRRSQHDFGYVKLAKPAERSVSGVRLERQSPPSNGRRPSTPGPSRGGQKTIWLDELDTNGEVSVEEMCLSWYRRQGYKGFHSEGGIVRTLFAYLFFDVLFTYVPNVFQTEFQTCPLDLHTDSFYPARRAEINSRLAEIANGDAEGLVRSVWERENEKATCVTGLDWSFDIEDLVEIVNAFGGEKLATLCKIMAQEYAERGGGIPDLFLWKPGRESVDTTRSGEVMFAEVKSENDRLSDTQRLWIHVMTDAGVQVELCHAVAREIRQIQ